MEKTKKIGTVIDNANLSPFLHEISKRKEWIKSDELLLL